MMCEGVEFTTDHIKSHLQKYRQHFERCQAEFLKIFRQRIQVYRTEPPAPPTPLLLLKKLTIPVSIFFFRTVPRKKTNADCPSLSTPRRPRHNIPSQHKTTQHNTTQHNTTAPLDWRHEEGQKRGQGRRRGGGGGGGGARREQV